MIPKVDFCGLQVSRLIIGGNPFSGFSHQGSERDEEMLNYYTVERLKAALHRAEAAGINTSVMRSDMHIQRLLREYYNEGGAIQWIAQVGFDSEAVTLESGFTRVVACGAKAAYLHGGLLDRFYTERDAARISAVTAHMHDLGIPAGVAGHAPEAHLWAHELDLGIDFHVVCFYNCGSLHDGKGDKFKAGDPEKACAAIRAIDKPCIGYKIMGAGRVDARQAFEFAFANIKPTDCVNVGMYLGDNENMVEDNASMVGQILQ